MTLVKVWPSKTSALEQEWEMSRNKKSEAASEHVDLMRNYSLVAKHPAPPDVTALSTALPPGTWVYLSAVPGRPLDAEIKGSADLAAMGFQPVPHLAARMIVNLEALDTFLVRLSVARVRRVFVIGGDCDRPEGDIDSSLKVINSGRLQHHGISEVGVAGYPDGQPRFSAQELEQILDEKIGSAESAGFAVHIATQFCFNAESIIGWIRGLRDRGIRNPVRIGLPGPADAPTLSRYGHSCGVPLPLVVTELKGPWFPTEIMQGLADAHAAGALGRAHLSFFSFGGLSATARWTAEMARGGPAGELGGPASP